MQVDPHIMLVSFSQDGVSIRRGEVHIYVIQDDPHIMLVSFFRDGISVRRVRYVSRGFPISRVPVCVVDDDGAQPTLPPVGAEVATPLCRVVVVFR